MGGQILKSQSVTSRSEQFSESEVAKGRSRFARAVLGVKYTATLRCVDDHPPLQFVHGKTVRYALIFLGGNEDNNLRPRDSNYRVGRWGYNPLCLSARVGRNMGRLGKVSRAPSWART